MPDRGRGSERERPRTESSLTPNELAGRAMVQEFRERQAELQRLRDGEDVHDEVVDPDPEEAA